MTITLISFPLLLKEQTKYEIQINRIVSGEEITNQDIQTITQLEQSQNSLEPLKAFLYMLSAVALSIPLASLVLFSFTKVPFLKYIFKGEDNTFDYQERKMFYIVASAVYLGVAIIIASAIFFMVMT